MRYYNRIRRKRTKKVHKESRYTKRRVYKEEGESRNCERVKNLPNIK